MSASPRIVDYVEERREEYARRAFCNLLVEFLDVIIPGHSPANQMRTAVKDFVARVTNITVSGTGSRIIYALRVLDAMIYILRSPIIGSIHFEHSAMQRLSPLEEQLRWEVVDNVINRFRRYWDGRFGLKVDSSSLASQRPQILFEYISGLASRGFIPEEPYTRMLLVFMHNFENRIDLKNGVSLFRTFTCPTSFMKDTDILYEILGVLRNRCRDLFGMDTIDEVIFNVYKGLDEG
ncbi:hypothetical protein M413DRAFT_31605 [Hebeloma cylindrosporum]|uniref:Uncharacterized protein n=1 Tax=Hebeloma cylindrosporum TaxID=76867 RepID=A0A0C2Y687_HEBCY|nr:hypothetical protein M413DRAFT_31605 [Hebeloma cylindrosporum h7]